jgi:hypothetical protein
MTQPEKQKRGPGSDPGQSWWLGLGLLLFGVVNGLTTGLSDTPGTAQTLLSSLSAFVGGSLLTFAGFMRPSKSDEDKPQIDARRVGIGLSCFSVGVLIGLFGGMRLHAPETSKNEQHDEHDEGTPQKQRAGWALEGNEEDCENIVRKRETDWQGVTDSERRADEAFWEENCKK